MNQYFRWLVIVALQFLATQSRLRADDPITLRVFSYNIHHAEGVDGKLDVHRIADVIQSVKPDLVALQEVDQNVKRTDSVDQPAKLARLTGMHVAFGANIELQGGHYGNMILSRFPIETQTNNLLPNIDGGEQRGVLDVTIRVPDVKDPIRFLATHFDHRRPDRQRVASARMIAKMVEYSPLQPTLLAGDLNDVRGSDTLSELDSMWKIPHDDLMPTVPVTKPIRQIDFVLCRPLDRWRALKFEILDESVASDHRAIFAILELK